MTVRRLQSRILKKIDYNNLSNCDLNFDVHKFYANYLNLQGSIYKDSNLEIDDIWARQVVDDALKIISLESKM